jgi:hypothetical protein
MAPKTDARFAQPRRPSNFDFDDPQIEQGASWLIDQRLASQVSKARLAGFAGVAWYPV